MGRGLQSEVGFEGGRIASPTSPVSPLSLHHDSVRVYDPQTWSLWDNCFTAHKPITSDVAATAGLLCCWKLTWWAAQTQFKFLPARRKMH